MNFHTDSYESHKNIKHDAALIETWANEKTVDYYRHQRMYSQLDSLLKAYPNASWLTVGDGRYGTDAHYLSRFGAKVVASDINDASLKLAKEAGFITTYAVENAERLSFDDHHFDFVLCKESYHHFPRPMVALYEMIRVARIGVILIEPNDQSIVEPYHTTLNSVLYWSFFRAKQWLKNYFGKKPSSFPNHYETMGNYVYSISRRELEKVGLGLNLEALATKGLNDHYIEGVELEQTETKGPLYQQVTKQINALNRVSSKRPEAAGLLVAMLFKMPITSQCLALLKENKFEVNMLEKNPYIKS